MSLLPIRGWSDRGRRSALLLAVVTVAATVAAGVPAAARAASTASAPGAAQFVTLVTGDVVSVATAPNGRQEASVVRRANSGPGAQFQMFNLGSDLYVVPQSAVPYLGSTMDLSLFDVTALAASGSANTTVQVTYRSAAAPQSVPGIKITHRSGISARGVITPATGPRFGAALARQWRADHAAATHTTGLFASVARISATASAPPSAKPAFVMHTLTVNARNQKGKKDTGDSVLVYNVDNLSAFASEATFNKGIAKLSVPEGHYAAFSFFFDFSTGTVREVALWQFTVGGDTSIALDARQATAPVTVTTPQPATPAVNEVGIGRSDALGQIATFSFLGGGANAFDVQPTTQPVTIGQLHYFVYTRQFAADGSYSYDLEFPSDGAIPADEHYAPQNSDLAAIDSKYPASHAGTQGMDTRFGALPWQVFLFAADLPITTPIERTEYYSALPDINWQGVYYSVFTFSPSLVIAGQYQSAWTTYQPGTNLTTTWGGTPAGPRLLQAPIFVGETVCPACLNGTTLNLLGYPYGDNDPQHFGFQSPTGDEGETVGFGVFADGTQVAQGGFLQTSVTMPAAAQTYRVTYDTTRSSPDFLLSTAAQTSWSVPASVATSSLPSGWVCNTGGSTSCRVVPLITDSYDLPVNLLGQLPSGAASGQLDLGHLAGANIGFGSVQVNVSFDGGQSWQPVTVTDQGSGHYGLAFTVPAAAGTDGYGALQVSVTDAAGGTFDQTIQHAFAVGS